MMFSFLFLLIKNFSKRLIPLLSLEGLMLVVILGFYSTSGMASTSFFAYGMLFLVMMVIDSVLGICMLIGSCRSSTPWSVSF